LENDPDVAMRFDNFFAAKTNFAARWRDKAGKHFQQGGFAAARWSEDDEEFAIVDREVERAQRRDLSYNPMRGGGVRSPWLDLTWTAATPR
jgi:hypothetical protein